MAVHVEALGGSKVSRPLLGARGESPNNSPARFVLSGPKVTGANSQRISLSHLTG